MTSKVRHVLYIASTTSVADGQLKENYDKEI